MTTKKPRLQSVLHAAPFLERQEQYDEVHRAMQRAGDLYGQVQSLCSAYRNMRQEARLTRQRLVALQYDVAWLRSHLRQGIRDYRAAWGQFASLYFHYRDRTPTGPIADTPPLTRPRQEEATP